jgi:hypothetical protein
MSIASAFPLFDLAHLVFCMSRRTYCREKTLHFCLEVEVEVEYSSVSMHPHRKSAIFEGNLVCCMCWFRISGLSCESCTRFMVAMAVYVLFYSEWGRLGITGLVRRSCELRLDVGV